MDRETAALLERASAFRRAGHVSEAIAAYRALLEREPDLPDSWYNLAWLHRQARQYEVALDSYAEALKRGVRDPEEVHLNRAVILSDHLARHDEAEAELEAALKLNPDYLPALLNLGNLHEDRGDREAAEAAYRRALEVAPEDPLALGRLAGVLDPGSRAAAELIECLPPAISRESDPAGRADLGFALGRLLDGRGDFDQAFAAYREANRASRDSFGPAFPGYGRAAHERFVDGLIAAFPTAAADQSAAPAPAIFVCGLFRSGSTLTEQILAGHSGIVSGGELDLVPALVSGIDPYPEAVAATDESKLESWRRFYLNGLAPFVRAGSAVTDKRPDNFLHIGLIKTLFPAAKIIHTRRDRLDNLLSLYFLHLGAGMPYALGLADAAHWHGEYERLMAHWKRLYPNDIFDIDYDALVREPEPAIRALLDFLGLDWEGQLLDFHRRSSAVKTASEWQVREPLHARSSGRWRNYETALRRALGDAFDS
jgi:tetratricopeptide (TPR) repeat protein